MLYINLIHISCFMFFADDLLLAVCSICNLDYGNDVRQKANLSDFFLFEFKMGRKAVETTHQHTTYLALEQLMSMQCSGVREALQRRGEL